MDVHYAFAHTLSLCDTKGTAWIRKNTNMMMIPSEHPCAYLAEQNQQDRVLLLPAAPFPPLITVCCQLVTCCGLEQGILGPLGQSLGYSTKLGWGEERELVTWFFSCLFQKKNVKIEGKPHLRKGKILCLVRRFSQGWSSRIQRVAHCELEWETICEATQIKSDPFLCRISITVSSD